MRCYVSEEFKGVTNDHTLELEKIHLGCIRFCSVGEIYMHG